MKSKRAFSAAPAILAALLTGGCLAADTSGIMVVNGRLAVEDREFAMNLRLDSDKTSHTAQGILKAEVRLQNTNHRDYRCQYKFEWLDAKGYVISHNESQWTPLLLHGREIVDVERVCTLKGAVDFRLKIRPVREVGSKGGYGDASGIVSGDPGKMEYSDKTGAALALVEKFLTDPDFDNIYSNAVARAKAGSRRRPCIAIGDLEDNSGSGVSDFKSMGQIRKELKARIRKTKLFDIVDFRNQDIAGVDGVDLMLKGEIARDRTGNVFFHFMNMEITNPETGVEVWQDTVKIRKE